MHFAASEAAFEASDAIYKADSEDIISEMSPPLLSHRNRM